MRGAAELALGCLSLELVAPQWRIVSSTCEDENVITVHLSMPTPSAALPADLKARFLVGLSSVYQASSALKRCPLHSFLLGWFKNENSWL